MTNAGCRLLLQRARNAGRGSLKVGTAAQRRENRPAAANAGAAETDRQRITEWVQHII